MIIDKTRAEMLEIDQCLCRGFSVELRQYTPHAKNIKSAIGRERKLICGDIQPHTSVMVENITRVIARVFWRNRIRVSSIADAIEIPIIRTPIFGAI